MRKICRLAYEHRYWRIKIKTYNQFQYPDIVTIIRVRILELFGHVVIRDRGKTAKTLLEGKPQGGRKRGRPGLRWMDAGC